MWSTTPSHSDYLLALDNDSFLRELQVALALPSSFSKQMPLIQGMLVDFPPPFTTPPSHHSSPISNLIPKSGVVGKRGAFPLKFEHTLQYTGKRVALVGDAAHTVHPMAGQGVNLGMADAHALIASVVEAVQTGQDIGGDGVMTAYEGRRKVENHVVTLGVDAIRRLFSLPAPFDRVVSGAVSLLNHLPPKNLLMKMAMGSLKPEDMKMLH